MDLWVRPFHANSHPSMHSTSHVVWGVLKCTNSSKSYFSSPMLRVSAENPFWCRGAFQTLPSHTKGRDLFFFLNRLYYPDCLSRLCTPIHPQQCNDLHRCCEETHTFSCLRQHGSMFYLARDLRKILCRSGFGQAPFLAKFHVYRPWMMTARICRN